MRKILLVTTLLAGFVIKVFPSDNYKNFKGTVYACAYEQTGTLNNLLTGEEIIGKDAQDGRISGRERDAVKTFDVTVKPHSYLVFQGK